MKHGILRLAMTLAIAAALGAVGLASLNDEKATEGLAHEMVTLGFWPAADNNNEGK